MIKSVSIVSMKDYETQINGQVCKILTRNIWSINYQIFFGKIKQSLAILI